MIDALSFLADRGMVPGNLPDTTGIPATESMEKKPARTGIDEIQGAFNEIEESDESDDTAEDMPWRRGKRRRSMGERESRSVDACQEAALTLLDAAPRSSSALADRLKRKGYTQETVDQVIANLTRTGLVNDELYARDALASCLARRMGARGALMDLTRRGVAPDLARQVVEEAEERGDFARSADELGRRIASKTEGLDSQTRLRRLWSAGGRKGHTPDDLRRVAREQF